MKFEGVSRRYHDQSKGGGGAGGGPFARRKEVNSPHAKLMDASREHAGTRGLTSQVLSSNSADCA